MTNDFDLDTPEGRLGALRYLRDVFIWDIADLLPVARQNDPWPVFKFVLNGPEAGIKVYTRAQVLDWLGKRDTCPELWDSLRKKKHEPGTAFFLLRHGDCFACTKTFFIPPDRCGTN
jgi:hypothetical protein